MAERAPTPRHIPRDLGALPRPRRALSQVPLKPPHGRFSRQWVHPRLIGRRFSSTTAMK
jgi:hypothetical protein